MNGGTAVLHNSIVAGNTETSGGFFDSDLDGTPVDPMRGQKVLGFLEARGVGSRYRVEVDEIQAHTPFHQRIGGDRRVDAAADGYGDFGRHFKRRTGG